MKRVVCQGTLLLAKVVLQLPLLQLLLFLFGEPSPFLVTRARCYCEVTVLVAVTSVSLIRAAVASPLKVLLPPLPLQKAGAKRGVKASFKRAMSDFGFASNNS